MSEKVYHFALKVSDKGDVSALCFKNPHPIDLKRASWTIRPQAVTCRKCRRILSEPAKGKP